MKLALIFLGALVASACAGDGKESGAVTETADKKGKRQTQEEVVVAAPAHYVYRSPRRQQHYEQVAAVHEPQEESAEESERIPVKEDYRPGQVYSVDARELLELQPERKAPYVEQQQLQQLYQEVQTPQVALQPSRTVIARPPSSANGGEVHVGAALSVSDDGANTAALDFDREILALLGHTRQSVRAPPPQQSQEQTYQPIYTRYPSEQKLVAAQYSQQVQQIQQAQQTQQTQQERYIPKPLSKSKTKSRPKVPTAPPPQQYLIETTNPQQVRQVQPARPAQSLRYVTLQPTYYERPDAQGLNVVAAPKFQQARGQLAYRYFPQPQLEGTVQKQYRIVQDVPKPTAQESKVRQEPVRYTYSPPAERPASYLKRYQASKQGEESGAVDRYLRLQQPAQLVGEQYYIRPVYRASEQRGRYELAHIALGSADTARALEPQQPRPAHSAIYVSKNTAPKKSPATPRPTIAVSVERHGESLDEQRARLPPPRNNKAYTPEEFAALVAAGYSVTPVPVHEESAQSRSALALQPAPVSQRERRPHYGQRAPQYLPFRGDDAP